MKKIIILMMVFVVSVFAGGISSQEIGVPYVEEGRGQVQSAVLTPDGESFYTLKDEIITNWQLEPIKKLNSFKIKLSEDEKKKKYHMSISSDSKKMIVVTRKSLLLFDLEKKKLIKKKKDKISMGVMDGSIFKIIYNKKILKDNRPIREVVYREYNIDNLGVIKEVLLPPLCNKSTSGCSAHYMHYINYMYMSADKLFVLKLDDSIAVFDKTTLKKLEKIWKIWNKCYFSLDKKNLYCTSNTGQYTKINVGILETQKIINKEFDNKKSSYINNEEFIHRKSLNDIYSNISLYKKLSLVFKFDINDKLTSLNFYDNKLNKRIATFYQFKNDKWILISSDGYFEVSKNARKYLKTKTLDGKTTPINDVIYKKYNKNIGLKDSNYSN